MLLYWATVTLMCMLAGPNGHHGGLADIMIKDLKLIAKDRTMKECKVYTGQKDIANQNNVILKTKLSHSPCNKSDDGHALDYPIFTSIKCYACWL